MPLGFGDVKGLRDLVESLQEGLRHSTRRRRWMCSGLIASTLTGHMRVGVQWLTIRGRGIGVVEWLV